MSLLTRFPVVPWLALLAAGASSQTPSRSPGAPTDRGTRRAYGELVTILDGTVRDLSIRAGGDLIYCTEEGEVGAIPSGGGGDPVVLAPVGTFGGRAPRALTSTPTNDIAVLVSNGDVLVLPGGALPANLVYDDAYMILDPTDIICDEAGNFIIASATPSNGQRAVNWISADGNRWAYYFVRHAAHMPVQLDFDPSSNSLVFADEAGGGTLYRVIPGDDTRPIVPFETATQPGLDSSLDDGDLAFTLDGDFFWAAGNSVYHHDRDTGQTALYRTFEGPVTGLTIADTSGHIPNPAPFPTGFSLFVAVLDVGTRIYEFEDEGLPRPRLLPDQGWVPGPGFHTGVNPDMQIFDVTTDNDGDLLISGALWSTTFHLRRIELPSKNLVDIADDTTGISGIVEGAVVAPDDTIYLVTRDGHIQAVTENPLVVTTLFTDPLDRIDTAKDLAMGVDGRFYVAERSSWGFGGVYEIDPANGWTATQIVPLNEVRGLAPNPAGGLYATEWNGTGFEGQVVSIELAGNTYLDLPGFANMNYTNGPDWGDGDVLVDATGTIYTVSEDDWSLARYTPGNTNIKRVGSGYLGHLSGLTVAPTSDDVTSSTGWSLYVTERSNIWEVPHSPGPGPSYIDNTTSLRAAPPGDRGRRGRKKLR